MDTLTGGEAMNLPRFKEILRHLRGTDPLFRDGSTGQWNDQRNLLGQMHPLEKMVFERSLHYFFDPDYSSLAYDDEMLGSKASDVEVRSLSDRKAAGEGSIIDCICDTYFQIILGMRLRTFLTTQVQNMHKLLERLPDAETNKGLARGPVLVMDRGFGKMDHVEEVVKKNFKLITVAATLGSQHPFVPTSAMQSYRDKLKQKKKPEELNYFNHYIVQPMDGST